MYSLCRGEESKVAITRLAVIQYAIDEAEWTREPETIPQMLWSDLILYMISTPRPHTQEPGIYKDINLPIYLCGNARLGIHQYVYIE